MMRALYRNLPLPAPRRSKITSPAVV